MQPFDLLPQFLKKLIQMFLTVILVRSNLNMGKDMKIITIPRFLQQIDRWLGKSYGCPHLTF